jgi:hypothetical protein
MSTLAIDSAHPRPSLWTDTLNQPPSLSLFWELYSDVEAVVYCITNDGRREGSRSSTSKRSEAQIKPELLPRLFKGSKPSIVTSWDTSKTAAALLKRSNVKQTTHFHSKQAEILAELLGGATATWQLTSVMLPTGCGKKSNGCASSSTLHLCSSKGALHCLLPFATGVLQADSRQYRNSHEIPYSTKVESTILGLFEPYERYLGTLQSC